MTRRCEECHEELRSIEIELSGEFCAVCGSYEDEALEEEMS
jgi:hypothetical protein